MNTEIESLRRKAAMIRLLPRRRQAITEHALLEARAGRNTDQLLAKMCRVNGRIGGLMREHGTVVAAAAFYDHQADALERAARTGTTVATARPEAA